uniref:Uncharacterized protein n=1 Tax=Ralstonia syzygii R24 TaxID=907261 RepID=G2ZYT2_9RALS|nr:hypothetical protein RALSY_10965 [Ralstonia syzygii R24]
MIAMLRQGREELGRVRFLGAASLPSIGSALVELGGSARARRHSFPAHSDQPLLGR